MKLQPSILWVGYKLLKQIHESLESFTWKSLIEERMSDTRFGQNYC